MEEDREEESVRTPLREDSERSIRRRPAGSFRLLLYPIGMACLILMTIGLFEVTKFSLSDSTESNRPLVIAITPTYNRITRMADMTRIAQTLMLVRNVFWVVVEDGEETSPQVKKLLERSEVPFHYLAKSTAEGWPKKGWSQRNEALDWISEKFGDFDNHAVVYFMDDDNAYDHRLFDEYIRKVKTIGIWAVGLVGDSLVEAPYVVDGLITKWNAFYYPSRDFAVDMAGFAIGLPLILNKNARLRKDCIARVPETCLLSQFGIRKEMAEPFGWESDPKELLVWHVKTVERMPRGLNTYGYDVETPSAKEMIEHRHYSRESKTLRRLSTTTRRTSSTTISTTSAKSSAGDEESRKATSSTNGTGHSIETADYKKIG